MKKSKILLLFRAFTEKQRKTLRHFSFSTANSRLSLNQFLQLVCFFASNFVVSVEFLTSLLTQFD
jgi:hypothetical protein